MRISRVEIENCLCFKRLALPVDASLQLLAGPNNAGKSSLVRLLETFFSDPDGEQVLPLRPAHSYYWDAGPRILSSIRIWFADLTVQERERCAVALRRDQQFWVALRWTRGGNVSFAASKNVSQDRARELYSYILEQHHFVKIPSVRVGGSGDAEGPASLERLMDTLEALLIRSGPGRSTSVQQDFADKATAIERVVKQVLDESAESIHSELPFQGGRVTFRLPEFSAALRGMLQAAEIESDEGAKVPVSQRGTGFQSALVLGILRYVASREAQGTAALVFAVEEPEAFLHPQTQRAMTEILKGISEDAQVLVTTHSPIVVDSFSLTQIARLPLHEEGTDFEWRPPDLSETDEGRLSRYCDAGNSELVFANAVVFVEGEGDRQVVERLLARVCAGPGGHYARGVTVVEANGLGKIKYLLQLARRFSVRAYVLSDKDGLRSRNGHRVLLDVLTARRTAPDEPERDRLRTLADGSCTNYREALRCQATINEVLEPFDTFVLASDLEGLLVDAFGVDRVAGVLGPYGEDELDAQFVDGLSGSEDDRVRLAKRLGSKGWQADEKPNQKMPTHLAPIVLEAGLEGEGQRPEEIRRLEEWLRGVVEGFETSRV